MVILGASFPYKKQVEEFRAKLGMRWVNDVLSEPSQEVSAEGQALPAFRFNGVYVERRELDGDGNPVAAGNDPNRGWEAIDLNKTYRPYVILTGKRFEPDDQELEQFGLIVQGLVMPRLMQFREENVHGGGLAGPGAGMPGTGGPGGGPGAPGRGAPPVGEGGGPGGVPGAAPQHKSEQDKYPHIEKDLALLQKSLQEMKNKNPAEIARAPEAFSADQFDVFTSGRDSQVMPPGGGGLGTGEGPPRGGMPGAGMRGSMPGVPPGRGMSSAPPGTSGAPPGRGTGAPPRPGMGEGNLGSGGPADFNQQAELPEHCLVRLVDVTVQPGKTYEYRLRVRMGNPNFGRRDVASPDYAKDKEILSDWSKTPIRVHVDPEMYYYAVDQTEWERTSEEGNKKYAAPYRNYVINPDKQVWLQAHRWLENVKLKGGDSRLEFGEWTIAERFPVHRGEYVGRPERVEVPVWRTTRESFVIASDVSTTQRSHGISVYFGYAADETKQPEVLLVDFDNGKHAIRRVVSRGVDDDVKTQNVSDDAGKDVLLMKPDGRLILLEGAVDFNDGERVDRVKKVRDRIIDVKRKEALGPQQRLGPGGRGGMGGGGGSPDG
jgi:hypothetical protein